MCDLDACIASRKAATCAELQVEAARLTAEDLWHVQPIHPDHLNRVHLGTISEDAFRFHCLYQRREQLRALCNTNSPEHAQERERLWQEMTRLKAILNCFLGSEVPRFNQYPTDLVFIDSNRAVYALSLPWEPRPEDQAEAPGTSLDVIIERLEATDHV